ncbi:MAG: PAC2 family protein [Microbacteriaceae bacterium]|nr:PAC2 family protein [Cryobacterium sp.]MBX3103552.1 PAC2 family protein [Cryobacterium sp.]MCC6376035.1 PAC2 family protein [Microbacteriaceae bacterium]
MDDPESLFELSPDAESVPAGLPLVAGLTGFADAGAAVTQTIDYLLETCDPVIIAKFENDLLLDYRARRPTIYFDQDHLESYSPPVLALYLAKDAIGQPFLLLAGYEPDFRWEGFNTAVLSLISKFSVKSTTWVHAIPMPVPHTRPIGVTVSGNRSELIETYSVWRPHTQVLANALHLFEFRLQESDHPIVGFVLLVPHYLSDTEFPDAGIKSLDSIATATGLVFALDEIQEESREFIEKLDKQVEGNPELAKLVATLEERHDSYMAGNPLRSQLISEDGKLPTADEIAAELEIFLALQRNGDEETGTTNPE